MLKILVIACISLLMCGSCTKDEITIFESSDVDQSPHFPGGTEAMYDFIYAKLKYPEQARQNDISGTVPVMFNVDKAGFLLDVHALSGPGYVLNEEAERVVQEMNNGHRWIPGTLNGEPVRVSFILPIKFVL